jgi:NitT/TauT family transport system substrate-binding protein
MYRATGLLVALLVGLTACAPAPSSAPAPTAPAPAAAQPAAPGQPAPASQTGAAPATREPLKLGLPGRSFGYLPTYVAVRRGFFQAEGFEPDVNFVGGDLQPAALATGEIDFGGASGTLGRAAVQGLPAKLVVFLYDRPTWSVVARPEITSVAQLKGRTVGVSRVGVSDDLALHLATARAGLADGDVTSVPLGVQMLQGLLGGSVDAAVLNADATATAKARGYNELVWIADLAVFPFAGFATTDQKLAQQREQVRRFVRGQVKALQYMLENENEVVQVAVEELDMEPDVARVAVKAAISSVSRTNPGGTTPEGIREYIDFELRSGLPAGIDVQPSLWLDLSILEEVQRALGIRR